jgi:hypothetical protein
MALVNALGSWESNEPNGLGLRRSHTAFCSSYSLYNVLGRVPIHPAVRQYGFGYEFLSATDLSPSHLMLLDPSPMGSRATMIDQSISSSNRKGRRLKEQQCQTRHLFLLICLIGQLVWHFVFSIKGTLLLSKQRTRSLHS